MRVLLNEICTIGCWAEQCGRSREERTRRKIESGAVLGDRKPTMCKCKLGGQRQHIENPEACAPGGLAIMERVPRKSHPRLEVAKRGIRKEGSAHLGCYVRDMG